MSCQKRSRVVVITCSAGRTGRCVLRVHINTTATDATHTHTPHGDTDATLRSAKGHRPRIDRTADLDTPRQARQQHRFFVTVSGVRSARVLRAANSVCGTFGPGSALTLRWDRYRAPRRTRESTLRFSTVGSRKVAATHTLTTHIRRPLLLRLCSFRAPAETVPALAEILVVAPRIAPAIHRVVPLTS